MPVRAPSRCDDFAFTVDDRRAVPRAGERLISGHDAPSWKCMLKDVVWIVAPHLDDEVPDAERRCCAPSTSPDGN